jgi:hypothetical protein
VTLPAATKRAINRRLKKQDLASRLRANAYALGLTITSEHDRSLVALLKEAADAIEGKK